MADLRTEVQCINQTRTYFLENTNVMLVNYENEQKDEEGRHRPNLEHDNKRGNNHNSIERLLDLMSALSTIDVSAVLLVAVIVLLPLS